MSWWSLVVVALGLIMAVVAVQFDEPWLEIAGATTFVLLFAWVVVALRVRTGAVKSALSPEHSSSIPETPPFRGKNCEHRRAQGDDEDLDGHLAPDDEWRARRSAHAAASSGMLRDLLVGAITIRGHKPGDSWPASGVLSMPV